MQAVLKVAWGTVAMFAKKCASLFALIDPNRRHRLLDVVGKRSRRDCSRISSEENEERSRKRRRLSRGDRNWVSQSDVRVLEDATGGGGSRGDDVSESVGVRCQPGRQGRPTAMKPKPGESPEPPSRPSSRPSSLSRKRKGVMYEDEVLEIWRRTDGLDEVLQIGPRNAQVTCASIQTLRGNSWVNDEVVNCYLRLLQGRASGGATKFHIMSSYFYTQLTNGKYNYGNVRRWTKKDPALVKDAILMPINMNKTHWILAVVRLRVGVIEFYDSLAGHASSKKIFQNIRRWLRDEQADKKIDLKINKWRKKNMVVPLQGDGSSCGVFACVFAERVVAGKTEDFKFTQKDVQELRLGIAADILATALD